MSKERRASGAVRDPRETFDLAFVDRSISPRARARAKPHLRAVSRRTKLSEIAWADDGPLYERRVTPMMPRARVVAFVPKPGISLDPAIAHERQPDAKIHERPIAVVIRD